MKRYSINTLRADLLGVQKKIVRDGNGFGRYKVLHRTFTLTGQSEYANRAFITEVDKYQRGFQYDNLALTIGYGLISTEGEQWRRQRKLTQPAFDKDLLVRVMELTGELGQDVMSDWQTAAETNQPIDVFHDMQMLTMRVIGMALFSIDLKTTPNHFIELVRVALEVAIRRNLSPVVLPLWLPIPLHRKHKLLKQQVDQFIDKQIDQRLADNSNQTDVLGKLIASYGADAVRYRDELRDQLITLFFAGFETTATAVSWTWYLLSQNPEAEEKLHAELETVLGGRLPTYDDLDALTYTDQVIKEAMRIYSPVYTVTRHAVEDDEAGGCPVHRGDNILIPLHHIHQDEALWDDPKKFCPERFASLNDQQRRAYMPFGAGKHKCIGVHFATVEIVVAIAMIAQRYRLKLVDGHPVIPEPAVTVYPKHGLLMHVVPRA